jgi:Domain of unknown function (DUF4124)
MSGVKASGVGCTFGLLLCFQTAAAAQGIYTCTDANGKRLTSDRPIVNCIDRDQRVLNSDGSVKQTITRTLTTEERAEKEARDREASSQQITRQDAVRRDRNLMVRFPNEAAHLRAREAALDGVRKSMKTSESRLALLAAERQPLNDETEFYVGRQMPAKLKRLLDANDAATEAQRALMTEQQSEVSRINTLYDTELVRLKQLWAGAQPGSTGGPPSAAAVAPAAAAASAIRKASAK